MTTATRTFDNFIDDLEQDAGALAEGAWLALYEVWYNPGRSFTKMPCMAVPFLKTLERMGVIVCTDNEYYYIKG
jgi:hypothetical protein